MSAITGQEWPVPPYDRYLCELEPEPAETKLASGLILMRVETQTGDQRQRRGDIRRFKVLARGPGLWNETGVRQALQYEVGQTVLAQQPMEIDGFLWEGRTLYVIDEGSVMVGLPVQAVASDMPETR